MKAYIVAEINCIDCYSAQSKIDIRKVFMNKEKAEEYCKTQGIDKNNIFEREVEK